MEAHEEITEVEAHWVPSPRRIVGDGSRSHWRVRQDRERNLGRRVVLSTKLAWLDGPAMSTPEADLADYYERSTGC